MEDAKIDMRTREGRAMRPAMRSEDPRRDAAERAKEIMGSVSNFGDTVDKFWFDPSKVPDGWHYEWKEYMVMGKIDPSRQIELARTGWEAVPASRHPGEMPAGSTDPFIIRDGVRLMERPMEVTEMARKFESRAARDQMRNKREQLEGGAAAGVFDATNNGDRLSRVKSSYRPTEIPD